MPSANSTRALCFLLLLAACGEQTTSPDASEPADRAHLVAVEVHRSSGEIAAYVHQGPRYFCPMLDCSVWVYVSNPGAPGRTILIDVQHPWILPPLTFLAHENELARGAFVKIYEGAFDASHLQMAEFTHVVVRMTETSPSWGAHSEEMRVDVDF